MLILDTVIVTVDENVLFAVRNRTHHSNIKSAKMKHCALWRWAILSPTEIQIMWISVQKCPQYLPDGRWHYVLNFASYIFVRTKILLIVFVPCLHFRISLSLVDEYFLNRRFVVFLVIIDEKTLDMTLSVENPGYANDHTATVCRPLMFLHST